MTNQKTYGPKVLGVVWIWASRNGLPKYQYNLDLSGVVDLVPKMKAVNGFRKKYRSCLFLKSLPKDLFFEHICLTYMIYHDWYTQIKQYILFSKLSRVDTTQFPSTFGISGFPKMVGFPNKPMGFPSKNWSFWGPFWGYHHLRKPPYPFTSHGPPNWWDGWTLRSWRWTITSIWLLPWLLGCSWRFLALKSWNTRVLRRDFHGPTNHPFSHFEIKICYFWINIIYHLTLLAILEVGFSGLEQTKDLKRCQRFEVHQGKIGAWTRARSGERQRSRECGSDVYANLSYRKNQK